MSRVSGYPSLLGADLAANDLHLVIDVSDTSTSPTGKDKTLTTAELLTVFSPNLAAYLGKLEPLGGFNYGNGLTPTFFAPHSAAYDDGAWFQFQYDPLGQYLDLIMGVGNTNTNPPLVDLFVTSSLAGVAGYMPGTGNQTFNFEVDATGAHMLVQAGSGQTQANPLLSLLRSDGTSRIFDVFQVDNAGDPWTQFGMWSMNQPVDGSPRTNGGWASLEVAENYSEFRLGFNEDYLGGSFAFEALSGFGGMYLGSAVTTNDLSAGEGILLESGSSVSTRVGMRARAGQLDALQEMIDGAGHASMRFSITSLYDTFAEHSVGLARVSDGSYLEGGRLYESGVLDGKLILSQEGSLGSAAFGLESGYVFWDARSSVPSDSLLTDHTTNDPGNGVGVVCIYLDETGHNLKFRVRESGGAFKTATLAMT